MNDEMRIIILIVLGIIVFMIDAFRKDNDNIDGGE